LVQVALLEHVWFGAAITQVAIAFCYSVHLCTVYAYLPELTNDHKKITKYASRFTAAQYTASVIYLVLMVYILEVTGVSKKGDMVSSAVVSQSVVVMCCLCSFGYAWSRLFRDRPARHQVPPEQSIYSAGVRELIKTTRSLLHNHKAICWFLCAISFSEAASSAFSSIAITYMTDQLHFSSTENGIAILLLLVFAVPGTRIGAFMSTHFNPVRSLQTCLVFWMINTGAAAMILHGRGQQVTAFSFAVVWGLCLGWLYPTEKTLYVSIINKGQEAELMGVYICASQILAW
jgi:MFS-type transporter involved in bile tolerance (Atg22 family)